MKKILLICILFFPFNAKANSFNFDIKNIDLINDAKTTKIMENMPKEYLLDEQKELNNYDEEAVSQFAINAISKFIGGPKSKIDYSYNGYITRTKYFLKDVYKLEDLPTDKNKKVLEDFKYYNNYKNTEINNLMKLYLGKIEELQIDYEKIGLPKVSSYTKNKYNIVLKIPNATINGINKEDSRKISRIKSNIYIDFDILKTKKDYKILRMDFSKDDIVTESIKKVESNERLNINNLNVVVNYNDDLNKKEDEETIKKIYEENKDLTVIITTTNKLGDIRSNSNGTMIRPGVIVTSWSYIESALINNENINIRTSDDQVLSIDGIITVSKGYDLVVLKLNKEVGTKKTYPKVSFMNKDDLVVSISSQKGIYLNVNAGTFIEKNYKEKIVKNKMILSQQEVGSPLFNKDGNLIGINSSKIYNSSFSYAIDINVLQDLLWSINLRSFDEIKSYKYKQLTEDLYFNNIKPNVSYKKDYNKKVYNNYMKYGNVKEYFSDSIKKINTLGNMLSIRVDFSNTYLIDVDTYISGYVAKLKNSGFKEKEKQTDRIVLENNKHLIKFNIEKDYFTIVYRKR